jgi:hypothetical protein
MATESITKKVQKEVSHSKGGLAPGVDKGSPLISGSVYLLNLS